MDFALMQYPADPAGKQWGDSCMRMYMFAVFLILAVKRQNLTQSRKPRKVNLFTKPSTMDCLKTDPAMIRVVLRLAVLIFRGTDMTGMMFERLPSYEWSHNSFNITFATSA